MGADTLARSWAAQLGLCRRFRQLERRKHITGVAVVAVARELAGFLWAEMHAYARMTPTLGRSPIGAPAPASPRTRRSTADAGKIPATLLPRPRRRDASSLGPRPAHSRLAVPTREHQSGGPPIHAAPTRSWPTLARPPPTGHLADAPSEHQELLTGGSPLDGAVPYQKVKRVGHGFRNFTNYRLRLLLHCGISWQTHRTTSLRGRSPRLVA